MKHEIEVYKGQSIEYDEDTDKFVCDITIEDHNKSTKRQSLKDVRREIDAFIKANLEFKPFRLFEKRSYGNELEELEVTGIRTDGKFIVKKKSWRDRIEQVDFDKEIRSGDEFFYYDTDIKEQMEKLKKDLENYSKEIHDKEKKLLKKLKKFDTETVKHYIDAFKK